MGGCAHRTRGEGGGWGRSLGRGTARAVIQPPRGLTPHARVAAARSRPGLAPPSPPQAALREMPPPPPPAGPPGGLAPRRAERPPPSPRQGGASALRLGLRFPLMDACGSSFLAPSAAGGSGPGPPRRGEPGPGCPDPGLRKGPAAPRSPCNALQSCANNRFIGRRQGSGAASARRWAPRGSGLRPTAVGACRRSVRVAKPDGGSGPGEGKGGVARSSPKSAPCGAAPPLPPPRIPAPARRGAGRGAARGGGGWPPAQGPHSPGLPQAHRTGSTGVQEALISPPSHPRVLSQPPPKGNPAGGRLAEDGQCGSAADRIDRPSRCGGKGPWALCRRFISTAADQALDATGCAVRQ